MEKFDPKDPNEIIPLTFDFRSELDGQTISSATVEVETYSGVDASPSAILSGAHSVAGDRVRQNVRDGLNGVEYLIRVTATTAAGLKYTIGKVLPVTKAGTY